MKHIPTCGICLLTLGAATASATEYSTIPVQGVVVTGIRSTSTTSDDVIITASYTDAGFTSAAIYNGSLAGAAGSTAANWTKFNPGFSGVTSSTFYGPNTALFTPSIGAGNIIAVGSYKVGTAADRGMMYQGPVDGIGGTWTSLDATPLVTSGTLLNTIAHSNMGDLVVGNYDTNITTGNAFIYDRINETWTNLNPGGSASVTAYGIWQNSSTSYTIAGGFSDLNSGGVDSGYLVNYDSATGILENYKTFQYNNEPISSLIAHFDGITATETGFNLTGDYLAAGGGLGAFSASVTVLPGGFFSNATWTDVTIPGSSFISGNTVVGDTVLGIYTEDGVTLSYIATVPEPSSMALFALGLGLPLLRFRKRG